jgi:hypothetical protein
MKELAYGRHDADTFDKAKSDDFSKAFVLACAQAKLERERRYHKPRLINYGGY